MVCKPQADRTRLLDLVERAAVGASLLCLIHCAGLPLLLALLPALSHVLAFPESLHLWLLAFAIPTSALALGSGYRDHHLRQPLLLGAAGLLMMATGGVLLAGTRAETLLTILGGLTLASGHIRNWQLRHSGHPHG